MLDARGPPLRILCVDDNHDVADSTALLLSFVGFMTRACYDGPAALHEAEAFCPDTCLIDFNMPGMNGAELATRLRAGAAGRPLRLVAMTALCGEESRARIAAVGFDHHLVKPANLQELLAVIGTAG